MKSLQMILMMFAEDFWCLQSEMLLLASSMLARMMKNLDFVVVMVDYFVKFLLKIVSLFQDPKTIAQLHMKRCRIELLIAMLSGVRMRTRERMLREVALSC